MKKLNSCVLMALTTLAFAGTAPAFAAGDDLSKLKELERAMATPSEPTEQPKKRVRTRAIVMDSENQAAEAPAQIGTPSRDCQALSPDVKSVAVDFAIQFELGSAKVSGTSVPVLNEIAKILALSPNRCVLVEGHTDAIGDFNKNMALSSARADSVVSYVVETKGLERKNLVAVGKGSTEPLKDLNPRDAKNRRVVFKVVTN
jgi:outer membrane protein OmpA-like peptidoglycan-associated protein